MSAIDTVLGKVTSALGNLTGEQTKITTSVIDMVNKYPGGIVGFVQSFKDKGLGNIVTSWIGDGKNLPITPAQIQNALGESRLQQLAGEHKLNIAQVSEQLVKILPVVVDKLTPSGVLPSVP